VPAVDPHPGGDPRRVAGRVLGAGVAAGEAVDVGEPLVVVHLLDFAEQADVAVPAGTVIVIGGGVVGQNAAKIGTPAVPGSEPSG
jgi:alanine dehydrogenase